MADNPDIAPGAEFSSFLTLSAAVKRWEESNFVCLYRRSSRSIDAHAKRASKKTFNTNLKFAEIDYACIHGGRKLKTSTKGQRPNQSTFLKDCPFTIKVRVTEDGQNLYVKKMGTAKSHNHELCKNTFEHLPKQRRLTESESSEVGKMVKMKANNKQIQQYLLALTGKNVILKDIHNIRSKILPNKRNNFEELVTEMKKITGAAVDTLTSSDNIFQAIAFQTEEMRITFAAYPELLLIDTTHKLDDLGMPLYVLMNVDGNGESEIICLWLVVAEDQLTISSLIDKFKERNVKWTDTGVIMADKDMIGRDILTEKLPGVEIQICHFHTRRSFRREIATDKLGISVGERSMCLKFLSKMSRAKGEEEYQGLYAEFTRSAPRSVVEYFTRNWHDIREQWVKGLKNAKANFLNSTNNRLESTSQKIKSVISRYSGISAFFQDLMLCISALKNERDHRASYLSTKITINRHEISKPEMGYKELLTPYAFMCLEEQLDYSAKTKILGTVDDRSATVESKLLGNIGVSVDSCQCSFFSCMLLPCRHVFAVRRCFNMPLYDETLCAKRWTRTYFRAWQGDYYNPEPAGVDSCSGDNGTATLNIESCERRKSNLSELEKYQKAYDLLEKIGQIISEQGMKEFEHSMNVLESLRNHLQLRKKVAITEWVDKADEPSITDPETLPGNVVEISQEPANCQIPVVFPESTSSLAPSGIVSNTCMVKMSPKHVKRGRPKGGDVTTAVGMPRKKRKRRSN